MASERAEAPQDDNETYDSLTSLREAHARLIWTRQQAKKQAKGAAAASAANEAGTAGAEEIRKFLERAQAAGAFISEEEERHRAQSILDYWTAEYLSTAESFDADFTPARLADFDDDRGDAAQRSQRPEAQIKQRRREESRELVQLAAAARQWKQWNRDPGLLLSGDSLKQAALLRHCDPDLEEFVTASEAAEAAWKTRKRVLVWSGFGIGATAVVVFGIVVFMHFIGFPSLSEREIAWIKNPASQAKPGSQATSLKRLAFYQLWMTPTKSSFDLSSAGLEDVKLRKLRLYVPNFSQANVRNVEFQEAEFAYASFSDSRIDNLTFDQAALQFAQFREAKIASASFAGATLYRATFDRACLGDVKFSGADLRATSFWAVQFDGQLQGQFENTAWWLAIGWSSEQLRKLLPLVPLPQSKALQALRDSRAFKDDMDRTKLLFKGTDAGTFDRALALNGRAWTLATWGVGVANAPMQSVEAAKNSAVCDAEALKRTDIPENALDAAAQAVCIVQTLNDKNEDKGKYNAELAGVRDTLAYVLMQMPGRMVDAARMYANDIAPDQADGSVNSTAEGEVLFRAAVAQDAIGDKDKASKLLQASIDRQYAPTHELQNLQEHMPEAFREQVYRHIDSFWPTKLKRASCQRTATAKP